MEAGAGWTGTDWANSVAVFFTDAAAHVAGGGSYYDTETFGELERVKRRFGILGH